MALPPKRGRKEFSTRAMALYVPWPKAAGSKYDTDAVYNGAELIGSALRETSGSLVNYHDVVSCEALEKYLTQFIEECKEADPQPSQAILYLCAHGRVNESTGDVHLLMNDSPDPLKDEQGFYEKSISGAILKNYINRLKCAMPNGKVWVLVESCYSGALYAPKPAEITSLGCPSIYSGRFNDEARAAVQSGSGLVVLMSSGPGEESRIDPKSNVPYFTQGLVEFLEGFPAGEKILMPKLVEEVTKNVVQATKGLQNPCWWSEGGSWYGGIGVGPGMALQQVKDEQMEVDTDEWLLGVAGDLGDVKLIPDGSSPEKVKEYFEKHKSALDNLAIATERAGAPAKFRSLINELWDKFKHFTFEEKKSLVLCGQTGDGKSTLINALVGTEVLPAASDGPACTSVVWEVHVNVEDESYKAEVEFLSYEECKSVLEKLQSSWLKGDENEDPEMKDDDFCESSEDAHRVLEDMFGDDIPASIEKMLEHSNINSYIVEGTHKIVKENPEDLKGHLENRISHFYRLVKKVKICVPTQQSIPKSVILVDIPGHHDANLVRKQIADQQFKDGNMVWVVSSIGRASSNETCQMLLTKIMEGDITRLSTLALICTQNDDKCGPPRNMESKFRKGKDDPEMTEIEKHLQELFHQQKDEKDKGKKQILTGQWKLQYTKWREQNVKRDFLKKFEKSLSDKHINLGDQRDVSVFAVSATDYLHLLKKEDTTLFTNSEDTGIPRVQRNLQSIIDRHNHFKVEKLCQESARLCKKLESKVGPNRKDQDEEWENNLEKLMVEVKNVTDQFQSDDLSENIKAIETRTDERKRSFNGRIARVLEKYRKLHYRTLKAIMDTNGRFIHSKKPKKYILSEDLMTDMIECVIQDWGSQFDSMLEKLRKFEKDWIAKESVRKAFETLGRTKPEFVKELVTLCGGKIWSGVAALGVVFNETTKNAVTNIKEEAQANLAPLFEEWRTGKSAECKKKDEMVDFLCNWLLGEIGQNIISGIITRLQYSLRSVQNNVKGELDTFREEMREMLTTKMEGLKDAPGETTNTLFPVVAQFKMELKASLE